MSECAHLVISTGNINRGLITSAVRQIEKHKSARKISEYLKKYKSETRS